MTTNHRYNLRKRCPSNPPISYIERKKRRRSTKNTQDCKDDYNSSVDVNNTNHRRQPPVSEYFERTREKIESDFLELISENSASGTECSDSENSTSGTEEREYKSDDNL